MNRFVVILLLLWLSVPGVLAQKHPSSRWYLDEEEVRIAVDTLTLDTAYQFVRKPYSAALRRQILAVDSLVHRQYLHKGGYDVMPTTAFYTLYYKPDSLRIKYVPYNRQRALLDSLDAAVHTLESARDVRGAISRSAQSLMDMHNALAMRMPEAVNITYGEIPTPWRELEGGKFKKQEDVEKSHLASIFTREFNEDFKIHKAPEKAVSPWKVSGEENMQLSQLFLSNWIKGGESSLTLSSDMRAKVLFVKDRHNWESNGVHKLGLTYTGSMGSRVSDDALNIDSKYGFKAVNKWYYSFQYSFKTQMFRNYKQNDTKRSNPQSKFFSPAYMNFIFGMDYKTSDISILLAPYSCVLTIVGDTVMIDQTKFGIDKDKKSKALNGFSINVSWKKQVAYNVTYSTKLEMFYEYFRKNGNKQLDWENIISMQINRFLTTRLLLQLRYYDNESKKFQVKENFSIAFKYTF